jgi:hypothetical protein
VNTSDAEPRRPTPFPPTVLDARLHYHVRGTHWNSPASWRTAFVTERIVLLGAFQANRVESAFLLTAVSKSYSVWGNYNGLDSRAIRHTPDRTRHQTSSQHDTIEGLLS